MYNLFGIATVSRKWWQEDSLEFPLPGRPSLAVKSAGAADMGSFDTFIRDAALELHLFAVC
jgi:hypothetical protein